jgi:hypothetical protein
MHDDVIVGIFLHFFGKNANEEYVNEIEAYLVRLCAVQLLPVIPDFCRPFANDSLVI